MASGFSWRGADGADAASFIQDPFTVEVLAALDAPFDEEPSKELDPGRGPAPPDEVDVGIHDTPSGAEFVEGGREQRAAFLGAEREGALVRGARERRPGHHLSQIITLSRGDGGEARH